jgi:hypothetical protein
MIVIRKILTQTCKVYCPANELIGEVNEHEFNDVRAQIKEQKLEGYYAIFDLKDGEYRFNIDSNGRSNDWTDETFGEFERICRRLL